MRFKVHEKYSINMLEKYPITRSRRHIQFSVITNTFSLVKKTSHHTYFFLKQKKNLIMPCDKNNHDKQKLSKGHFALKLNALYDFCLCYYIHFALHYLSVVTREYHFRPSPSAQLCSKKLPPHPRHCFIVNIDYVWVSFHSLLPCLVFSSACLFQLLVFSKTFSNGGTVNLIVQGNIFQMRVSKLHKLPS